MAIPKEIAFKVSTNLESLKTQLSFLAGKVARLQHLMNELNAGLIDIENGINECDVDLKLTPILIERTEDNARE